MSKSIKFKVILKGKGIVNFDGDGQKFIHNQIKNDVVKSSHDNVKYAKKDFFYDSNGDLDYKIKISSNCLRKAIFKQEMPFQNPNLKLHSDLFIPFYATPSAILRGYMYAGEKGSVADKRKSPITITDAIQINNTRSYIETQTRSGEKKNTTEDRKDTSFFQKETIGEIEYEAEGFIDLHELQFFSLDKLFDRTGFSSDLFPKFKLHLQRRMKTFNSELGFFGIKDSSVNIPEEGFKFSNTDVDFLVKFFLKELLSLKIVNGNSYASVASLQIKEINNVFDDINNPNGWTNITPLIIDSLIIDTDDFYIPYDNEQAKKDREIYENLKKSAESNRKKDDEARREEKKNKKNNDSNPE